MADFNLQDFLRDMREEQNDKIDALTGQISASLKVQARHDTRITLLERFRVNSVKMMWLGFGAFVVFLLDLIKDHVIAATNIVKP